MDARKLMKLGKDLAAFLDAVVGTLDHPRRRRWCEAYVCGGLLDGQRKTIQEMADRLKTIDQSDANYEQSLQQFINQIPCDDPAMLGGLQAWIAKRFGTDGYLILGDTDFPEQGRGRSASSGSARGR